MKTFEEIAREAIKLFRIRYGAPHLGAALPFQISGDNVIVQETAHGERPGRRFWVKIRHADGIESISMDLVDGAVVRNLAAPDGTMIKHH
jgi:hypothetical protein